MVVDVQEGSAGEKAGLKRYDVITAVSDKPVDDGDQLVRVIAARPPGSSVVLTVFRDGKPLQLTAKLAERDTTAVRSPAPSAVADDAGNAGDALGLMVAEPGPEMQAQFSIPDDRMGVVVREVLGLSPGAETLADGDLIVEVNRKPTRDLATYRKAVAALTPGEAAWLFVYRPRLRASFLAKLEVEEVR
jgi:serine protease Do